jgi:hypothetical protein
LAQQELAAGNKAAPACTAVGGLATFQPQSGQGSPVLQCVNIGYLGNDGLAYRASVDMDPITGRLTGPMDTGGKGATQQECQSGSYPNAPGAPRSVPTQGQWNNLLQACLGS